MSKLEANQVDPATGTTLTLGTSGDTISIPSGVTIANSGTATGFGGDNTPAVSAYMSSSQTPSDNVYAKIQYNTELYDTDSAYDHSTNYRFTVPSGEAGKYFIYAACYMFGNNNDEKYQAMSIYLNGSQVRRDDKSQQYGTSQSSGGVQSITGVLDLAVSDYIEIYGKIDVNSGTPSFYGDAAASNRYSVLEIFKLVE